MSEAFASAYNEYNGKDLPAPFISNDKPLPTKEELNAKFEKIFGSMKVVTVNKD